MKRHFSIALPVLLGALAAGGTSSKERGTRLEWERDIKTAWEKAVLRNVPLLVVFSSDG